LGWQACAAKRADDQAKTYATQNESGGTQPWYESQSRCAVKFVKMRIFPSRTT
jgi:hypothetical protein